MSIELATTTIVISGIALIVSGYSVWYSRKQVKALQEQTTLSKTDYEARHNKDEFHTALKLTKFYSDEILPAMDTLLEILEKKGVSSTLEKVTGHNLVDFDKDEFEKIFTKDDVENKIKKIYRPNIPTRDYMTAFEYSSNLSFCDFEASQQEYFKTMEGCYASQDLLKSNYQLSLQKKFVRLITYTTNNLEYFSMYFNTKLAEDEIIFCSLHQTFLSLVETLYFDIAPRNTDVSQKYYVHTIALYKKWKKMDNENRDRHREKIRQMKDMPEIKTPR